MRFVDSFQSTVHLEPRLTRIVLFLLLTAYSSFSFSQQIVGDIGENGYGETERSYTFTLHDPFPGWVPGPIDWIVGGTATNATVETSNNDRVATITWNEGGITSVMARTDAPPPGTSPWEVMVQGIVIVRGCDGGDVDFPEDTLSGDFYPMPVVIGSTFELFALNNSGCKVGGAITPTTGSGGGGPSYYSSGDGWPVSPGFYLLEENIWCTPTNLRKTCGYLYGEGVTPRKARRDGNDECLDLVKERPWPIPDIEEFDPSNFLEPAEFLSSGVYQVCSKTTSVIYVCDPNRPPSPSFTVSGGTCPGDAITLTASPNNASLYDYIWEYDYPGEDEVQVLGGPTLDLERKSSNYYVELKIRFKNVDACSGIKESSNVFDDRIDAGTQDPLPVTVNKISGGDCEGDVITLEASPGNNNHTYVWGTGMSPVSGEPWRATTTLTSTAYPNRGTVTVTPNSTNGCYVAGDGNLSGGIPMGEAIRNPAISISANKGPYTYCADETVKLTVTYTSEAYDPGPINWYDAAGNFKGSGNTLDVLGNESSSFKAVGTDSGCTNNTTYDDTFTMAYEPSNKPTIDIVPSLLANSYHCEGTQVNISGANLGFIGASDDLSKYTIEWTDNNNQSVSAGLEGFDAILNQGANTFTVIVTANHKCDQDSDPKQVTIYGYEPDQLGDITRVFCGNAGVNTDVTSVTVDAGIKKPGFVYELIPANGVGKYTMNADPNRVVFEGVPEGQNYDIYANYTGCDVDIHVGQVNVEIVDRPETGDISGYDNLAPSCSENTILAPPTGINHQWVRIRSGITDVLEVEADGSYEMGGNDYGQGVTYRVTYDNIVPYTDLGIQKQCTFQYMKEITIDIEDPKTPSIELSIEGLNNGSICSGDEVTINASLTNIDPSSSFQWSIKSGDNDPSPISGGTITSITQRLDDDAIFILDVFDIPGCLTTDQVSAESDTVDVAKVNQVVGVIHHSFCSYSDSTMLELGGADRNINYILFKKSSTGNYIQLRDSSATDMAVDRDGTTMRFGLRVEGEYRINGYSDLCGQSSEDALEYIQLRLHKSITPCFNHITTITNDEMQPFNHIRSIFDLSGDLVQENVLMADESELVTQTHYDSLDRVGLTTLPARAPVPSDSTIYLDYYLDFITENSEDLFTHEKWNKATPDPIPQIVEGTLGHYYSANNSDEPWVDYSAYPYVKTDYYTDGSGEVKTTYGPGEKFVVQSTHRSYTKTFPVGTELDGLYLVVRDSLLDYQGASPSLAGQVVKTVTSDPHGKEVITYIDASGNALVSAYGFVSGGVAMPMSFYSADLNLSLVDFHLPTTNSNKSISGSTVTNLITDEPVIGTPASGCFQADGAVSFDFSYYNASFNIFDERGRLVASISPKGVEALLDASQTIDNYDQIPYTTYYEYDFEGRLLSMREPDAGTTYYIYRKDGSIRFSQNDLQRTHEIKRVSYTTYDRAGHPVESGEYWGKYQGFPEGGIDLSDSTDRNTIQGFAEYLDGDTRDFLGAITNRNDFVRTTYDKVDAVPGTRYDYSSVSEMDYRPGDLDKLEVTQTVKFLPGFTVQPGERFHCYQVPPEQIDNRIAQDFMHGSVSVTENKNTKTWYTYDEQGRVREVAVWYKGLSSATKNIEYTYDFLGNVTDVKYDGGEAGEPAYYHHYTYDADKRLHRVYAAFSPIDPDNLSANNLQATYHYYKHGPLKRVEYGNKIQGMDYVYNLQGQLKSINDPNNTDFGGESAAGFYADAFAQQYGYYADDYTGGASLTAMNPTTNDEKYDGNIARVDWRTATSSFGPSTMTGNYVYKYDDRNYLLDANFMFSNSSKLSESNLSYDANGNILTLNRTDADVSSDSLDHLFSYRYIEGTNQIDTVRNSASGAGDYGVYTHDEIGQLVKRVNADGSVDSLVYDVTGKLTAVYDGSGALRSEYAYDDRGFRIMSRVVNGGAPQHKILVRDASGQLMATYNVTPDTTFIREEVSVYGANRLGVISELDPANPEVQYELKDHLGNVRSVVSGKYGFGEGILSRTDYYPFGAPLPGRKVSSPSYRYGYQGDFSEEDPETGLNYFELRMYDPLLGRWLTVDPERIGNSPYVGMANNPILVIDKNGDIPQAVWGVLIGAGSEIALQVLTSVATGDSWDDAIRKIDWIDVGISATTGALSGGISTVGKLRSIMKIYDAINRVKGFDIAKSLVNYKDGEFSSILQTENLNDIPAEILFAAAGFKNGDDILKAVNKIGLDGVKSKLVENISKTPIDIGLGVLKNVVNNSVDAMFGMDAQEQQVLNSIDEN